MGEKDGVWEDNDSETLERKTATDRDANPEGQSRQGHGWVLPGTIKEGTCLGPGA